MPNGKAGRWMHTGISWKFPKTVSSATIFAVTEIMAERCSIRTFWIVPHWPAKKIIMLTVSETMLILTVS